MDAVPGQFIMVWVPGVDEFPMSLSYIGRRFGITYQVVGEGTRALSEMKKGDRVGIRGPYGKGFELAGRRILMVAGGTGIAALGSLVEQAARSVSTDLILGARKKEELLFEGRCRRTAASVLISTDDGSKGFHGLATELAMEILLKKKVDSIYACGPEKMISGLLDMTSDKPVRIQASLERIMKCGIGVCDSCAIDGKHVCTDGPVFRDRELRALSDLGEFKRDHSGRRIPV